MIDMSEKHTLQWYLQAGEMVLDGITTSLSENVDPLVHKSVLSSVCA
jgi:hypothetical protein